MSNNFHWYTVQIEYKTEYPNEHNKDATAVRYTKQEIVEIHVYADNAVQAITTACDLEPIEHNRVHKVTAFWIV